MRANQSRTGGVLGLCYQQQFRGAIPNVSYIHLLWQYFFYFSMGAWAPVPWGPWHGHNGSRGLELAGSHKALTFEPMT